MDLGRGDRRSPARRPGAWTLLARGSRAGGRCAAAQIVTHHPGQPRAAPQDLFLEALEDGGDPIMLDLLDPPAVLMGTLAGIVGPDIRLCGVQPRTVIPEPPDDQGVAASYTSW